MRRVAVLAVLALVAVSATPVCAAAPGAIEFDEIDHVYTTEAVPQPGSFRQDAGLVTAAAPAPTEAPRRKPSIFDAITSAGTTLGNVSGIVGASGELGRALGVVDGVARLAPLTAALGMAGAKRFDTLLQTYVLPRVSPTGAVMLQGFLGAQTEYKSHYPSHRPPPQAAPPQQLAPYARGTIRHYTVAANGWVRIDDPDAKVTLIIKPDLGKSYALDANAKVVHISSLAPGTGSAAAATGSGGTAAVEDRVEQLAGASFDGIPAAGFRTRSTVSVAGGGTACPDVTIESTRVEYFSGYRIGADVANSSPLAHASDASGCDPAPSVKHAGSHVPADHLLLYQANTIAKTSASATDRYTVVIERGNLQERAAVEPSTFDVPSGYKNV